MRQGRRSKMEKTTLHPRNKHRSGYDFRLLCKTLPELSKFVSLNKFQNESIDFSDPKAVKMLNKALLKQFYGIQYWDIPEGYLCPPVPGRADYIHYLSDFLAKEGKKEKIKADYFQLKNLLGRQQPPGIVLNSIRKIVEVRSAYNIPKQQLNIPLFNISLVL